METDISIYSLIVSKTKKTITSYTVSKILSDITPSITHIVVYFDKKGKL